MKTILLLLFMFVSLLPVTAQIKVDSNYTVLARGTDGPNVLSLLYADLNRIQIKENASGKVCSPASMQFTLVIGSETFHAANATAANRLLDRSKPKDVIFIEKIVLPSDCFIPPKQIKITIM